jgi:hypothetical protein
MYPRCWKWELPYDSGSGRSALWRVAGMNRQFSAIMAAQDTLLAWENFYIIVGSSAGALTGLQFVVMALVSDSQARTDTTTIDTFGTPTVVHFCAVLLVSSILSAPWPALSQAAVAVGMIGAAGVIYSLIVVRRARRVTAYKPELEDWIFHCVLPLVAYTTLLIAGVSLTFQHVPALFGVALFTLILLFVGIHNAWDTVTYVTVALKAGPTTGEGTPRPPS